MTLICMSYKSNSLQALNQAKNKFLKETKFSKIVNVLHGQSITNPEINTLDIYYEDGRKNEGIWRDEMMGDIPKGSIQNSQLKRLSNK